MRSAVPVLGVTGAVGAGKSHVARLLGALGCNVIDADRMGHEALDRREVADAVSAAFGDGVRGTDGRLDRRRLAAVVFADRAALRRLEGIVHPVVLDAIRAALATVAADPPRAHAIDCALLFESGLDALCDATIAVEAPRDVRLRRVAARGWDAAETARRESAQWSADEKSARADHVLRNDGDESTLELRVRALLDTVAPERPSAARQPAGRTER